MDDPMPAGWYPDAADPALLRFWTGVAWSSHRKPRPGIAAAYRPERTRLVTGRRAR